MSQHVFAHMPIRRRTAATSKTATRITDVSTESVDDVRMSSSSPVEFEPNVKAVVVDEEELQRMKKEEQEKKFSVQVH